MPPEAPHSATTTPMMTATSEPADDRPAADWTAWLNTSDAPGGALRRTVPPTAAAFRSGLGG